MMDSLLVGHVTRDCWCGAVTAAREYVASLLVTTAIACAIAQNVERLNLRAERDALAARLAAIIENATRYVGLNESTGQPVWECQLCEYITELPLRHAPDCPLSERA